MRRRSAGDWSGEVFLPYVQLAPCPATCIMLRAGAAVAAWRAWRAAASGRERITCHLAEGDVGRHGEDGVVQPQVLLNARPAVARDSVVVRHRVHLQHAGRELGGCRGKRRPTPTQATARQMRAHMQLACTDGETGLVSCDTAAIQRAGKQAGRQACLHASVDKPTGPAQQCAPPAAHIYPDGGGPLAPHVEGAVINQHLRRWVWGWWVDESRLSVCVWVGGVGDVGGGECGSMVDEHVHTDGLQCLVHSPFAAAMAAWRRTPAHALPSEPSTAGASAALQALQRGRSLPCRSPARASQPQCS